MATQSILSTTLQLLRDKLVDNSYLAHPLFRAVEEHGNLIKVSGGLRVEQPVIFGDHSSITELTNGFEPVSMAVTDPFQSAKFEYANFTQPIVLSAVEKAANKGDLAVVNILESKMKNVMLSLKKEVSKQVIKGDSSVLGSLETLNGMGTSAVAVDTTGWFQSAAFGSQATNTVGGLSKSTYQAQNWQNQIFNSSGTLALNHIDELMINCQIYHPAGTFPDILLMSPAMYATFMGLQQSSVQYISAGDRETLDKDMVGMWRGARIYVEPNLGFANAAGDVVSAYALSSDMFQLYADTDGFFTVSDMLPVPGTATEAAMVFNRMQLVTGHLASHGVIINAES
ncbi:MAG: phage major capsid protein [Ilumatobacteraceae bacterium]